MLKLSVKKVKDSTQAIDPSLVYGTVRKIIAQFKEENRVAEAVFIPKVGSNLKEPGKMMIFIVREVNKAKKPENLLCSEDLFLPVVTADAVRTGEIHVSALLDFVVVAHTNNEQSANPGAEYPLIVRPQQVQDNSALEKFGISDTTEVTVAYERDTESLEFVLSKMQL